MTASQTSLPSRPSADAGATRTAPSGPCEPTTRAATHPAGQGTNLEAAARRALAAWGEWASTVAYDHHDPKRVALRRAMVALADALPEGVPA